MNMTKPIIYKSKVFSDDRGKFFPLQLSGMTENHEWIQSNVSISKKWTFRGLHHQTGEHSQSKMLSIIHGSILDFLVDLRKGSFEETYFFKFTPGDQIYIPKGFAHGFLALEDDTIIQYLVDNEYSQSAEVSFDWKSNNTVREIVLAEVGNESNLFISDKDKIGKSIDATHAETINYESMLDK